MPNDEFNATGTLEEGEFKPFSDSQNKKASENVHDETTDELSSQAKEPGPIRTSSKK